jgi:predicted negative regulator of RcsB-dependent stress response
MSERTHRHQLEKNLLADWLSEKMEQLKPYSMQLAVAGVLIVVGAIGAVVYFGWESGASARAWEQFYAAFGESKSEEALKAAIDNEKVKGTPAELWARLAYADTQLQAATLQYAEDRAKAKLATSQAEKTLKEIEGRTSDPALLIRAHFALGRVYESQNKLDEARKSFQKVVDLGKETPLGEEAQSALKRLDPKGEVAELLAWLDKQEIKPKSGTSSPLFPSLDQGSGLPERPNLNVPGFGAGKTGEIDFGRDVPLGPGAPQATPPDAKPESPTATPDDSRPDAEKRTKDAPAEKPAADDKREKPAKPAEDSIKPGEESKEPAGDKSASPDREQP